MPVKREQVVQTAEKYVARGKIEPAIREYRKLLEENPNDINTLNRVGDLYARIQRIDEAVDFFNQIAEQYAGEGFFVKAIAIYKKIIKLDPTRLDVYENLAELYHRQGLVTEARTQYQVLADYYQKHENATSTIAIYQKMAELEPSNPTYHVKLAELYHQQQLIEKAMGEYRIIAELMITHGHPHEAAQVYERALAIDSSNLAFITDAALKLKEAAGAAIAARFLGAAVERNPQAAQVARMVGGPPAVGAGAAPGGAAPYAAASPAAAPPPAPPAYQPQPQPPPAAYRPSPPAWPAAPPQAAVRGGQGSGVAAEPDLDLEMEIELDLGADLGSDLVADELAAPPAPAARPAEPLPLREEEEEEGPASRFGLAAGFDPAFEIEEEEAPAPAAPAAARQQPGVGRQPPPAPNEPGEVDLGDVFVLDIEDEEEPASLVKPPPDMLHEPRRPSWAQDQTPPHLAVPRPAPPPPAVPAPPRAAAGPAAGGRTAEPPPEAPPQAAFRFTSTFELINPFEALVEPEPAAEPPGGPWLSPLPETLPPLPDSLPPLGEALPEALPETLPEPSSLAASPAEPLPGRPGELLATAAELPAEVPAADAAVPGAPPWPPAADVVAAAAGAAAGSAPPVSAEAGQPVLHIDPEVLERTAAELQRPPVERYEDLVSEAEVLAKYGLEEKAIERLREAVRLKPRQFAAYMLLIQLLMDKGRHGRVVELANEVARLSESGDREPWAKLRRRLLAAGYRLDGDRIASAPQPPGGAPRQRGPKAPDIAAAAAAPASAAHAAAPEIAATRSPGAGEDQPLPLAASQAADAAQIEAAAAPAAPPPAAAGPRRQRKARDSEIQQILHGLVEAPPRTGRGAKRGAAAPPAPPPAAAAAPARAEAPPPTPADLLAAAAPGGVPEAPAAAPPLPAAGPRFEPIPPAGAGASLDAAIAAPPGPPVAAGPDLVELPPLLEAGRAAMAPPPPSPAHGEIFNPLEIGAMVESEEIDWDDAAAAGPGSGAGLGMPADGAAGMAGLAAAAAADTLPSSPDDTVWSAAARMPGGGALSGTSGGAGAGPAQRLPGSPGVPGFPGSPGSPVLPGSAAPPAPPLGAGAASLDDTGGMSWLDEADSGKHRTAGGASSLFDEEEDFFDLAGELERDLSQEPVFQGGEPLAPQEQSLEEIVEGFKRGVAEHLSPTDYDTHFNLGIAYREMGLLDEAIGEFQLSAKDPRYLVSCCSMLGLCFLDKGLPELAIKWYRRGLEAEGIGEEDTLGLLYDMGCAYLAMGDKAGAYKTFVDAYGINTNYRDLVARIEELRPAG